MTPYRVPVITFGQYVFCFEAEDEDQSMRHHFINECGWSEKEFRRIKKYAWFSAKVSVWKDGEEIATDYLGACCYKTEEQFYTTYKGDYFADMVRECARETKDAALIARVDAWHEKLPVAQARRLSRKQAKKAEL